MSFARQIFTLVSIHRGTVATWRRGAAATSLAFALAACGSQATSTGTGGAGTTATTATGTITSSSVATGGTGGTGGGSGGQGSAPITAAADQWTWVDFPDSKCASGTPTGIAVNPHAVATDVMIYFEGGGACTNATTCWGASPGAANLDGYDGTTFATAQQRGYPIFDRTDAGNPFRAVNMVYVPYCTGDLHAGSIEVDMQVNGTTKPTYFWGARDLDLFLERLVPTFSEAKRVWEVGTSAGGFGTFLTFDHVARAFGVRVDMLDDSGPPLVQKGGKDNSGSFSTWGFVPPNGCSPCTSFSEVLAFDRQSQPGSKFGFLSFAEDTTISVRYGYTLAEYPALIDAFSASLASDPNAATFVVTNEASHVVESDGTLTSQYLPWMTQMVNDDAAWADVTYAHP